MCKMSCFLDWDTIKQLNTSNVRVRIGWYSKKNHIKLLKRFSGNDTMHFNSFYCFFFGIYTIILVVYLDYVTVFLLRFFFVSFFIVGSPSHTHCIVPQEREKQLAHSIKQTLLLIEKTNPQKLITQSKHSIYVII